MVTEIVSDIKEYVASAVWRMAPLGGEIVVLSIGSDRVTGDCLGPLVGHMLAGRGVAVYGDLRSPVNALNVGEVAEVIARRHPRAFVIAVDSAVGAHTDIGKVRVVPRGICPAAATGKPLPRVGNISVVGIVAPKDRGAKALSEVRLGSVISVAEAIAGGIASALAKRRAIMSAEA